MDAGLTLIHGVCGTTILGEETGRAVVEGDGAALLRREVVKLASRRTILAPLRQSVNMSRESQNSNNLHCTSEDGR